MTGGACQADGQMGGINRNAFTNMIDNLLTGDAMAQQQTEGHVMGQTSQQQQNMMAM